MLEIIALIFLTKRMGILAETKGESKGKWKAFTVLAWFGFEIIGVAIMAMILGSDPNLFILMIFGLLCAFGGYLLIKRQLESYPDVEPIDDLIEQIGDDDEIE